MEDKLNRSIAIVGLGAILPDAPDVAAFWRNVTSGSYSISEVSPERWDPALHWDPDPAAPDRTYSKIGGWVRSWSWDPIGWKLPIPPRVAEAMDDGQKWAVACSRAALLDYGYPKRPLDPVRTAVIFGNAMGGERHLFTTMRTLIPEISQALEHAKSFEELPRDLRERLSRDAREALEARLPVITEDSMPGELSNIIAGRVANVFDLRGPNYTVDAACASSMAAMEAAMHGLVEGDIDAALTGGIDRNMGVNAFVKFCKIGALSATGTRPYADGADGFVMGEGAAVFLLKRLADAERDGDRIYAVLRGIGGSSDGKGKGITAPNPVGQKLAVQRAWQSAGLPPSSAGLIEGHGTSTKVGDVVEVESLTESFGGAQLPAGAIALGSVKSNIGHLKAAAGAAGLLKAILALHEKVLPPSLHCEKPNPNIDFAHSPFRVNRELQSWDAPKDGTPRRAGVSAFGFGGTNFHVVLEEFVPGMLSGKRSSPTGAALRQPTEPVALARDASEPRPPLRGALLIGATTREELARRLEATEREAHEGRLPPLLAPDQRDLRAQERVALDYGNAAELAENAALARHALVNDEAGSWKALRARGIFRGRGPAGKLAFLYTGQGSQYVGMLRKLRELEPIVAETFAEADREMPALLDRSLSSYLFADPKDPAAEEALRQTAITQPAVLTVDVALTRLFSSFGVSPDFVIGHSLGEYGALTVAGALSFRDALEAVSARGREMTRVSLEDNGLMVAVTAPLEEIEQTLAKIDGYAVVANVNSRTQAVIGGESKAVTQAQQMFTEAGRNTVLLPVSHAFHTAIVAPASEPLRKMLERLEVKPPRIPVVANVTGDFYPAEGEVRSAVIDMLSKQVAAPVQFVKGLETLYRAGARVFVEVGPKKALQGFAEEVLGDREGVSVLFTNHPKIDDAVAFNRALCGLYAAGIGSGRAEAAPEAPARPLPEPQVRPPAAKPAVAEPVVITGAGLGLPGGERVFADDNVARILEGEQLIDSIPARLRKAMLAKHITRLVKGEDGSANFAALESPAEVIKLAGRRGEFDLTAEFGVPKERVEAFDVTTSLAIAAGLEALRDAGIPLVLRYRTTTRGTQLPDRWMLPDELRDETGVIFASAFPGLNALAGEMTRYHRDRARREQLQALEALHARRAPDNGHDPVIADLARRIDELRGQLEREPYAFDRRFLFRVLSMGHSQFAEYIGARGPNTQVNSACASTTLAVTLAEDWIRAGRCRRVIVIAGDDATSDNLMEWIGAGFLASGAAATDALAEDAATPFDRRRHGMIVGMGAAAMVVESASAAQDRGLRPIGEVLGAVAANSAFHGTRLDVEHIGGLMERLISQVEERTGLRRAEIAHQLVFLSHETYTPARGGSAAAEVFALRKVFGADADRIVVANTKGFTGHPMGVGIEDVVALKALETGIVPPIPNFKEVDPELGALNLSKGGAQPVEYALRLAAGFGSQISMTLVRRSASVDGSRRAPEALGYEWRIENPAAFDSWVARVSGRKDARLEVVQRTLRVQDSGDHARRGRAKGEAATPAPAPRAASPTAPPVAMQAPAVEPGRAASPAGVGAPPAPAAPTPSSAATSPAASSLSSAATPPSSADPVRTRVLAIVAEKTGYPPEMIDPSLDLEADLGVDTVKQAETFAAVREAYAIPREENLKLRDFPTVEHVIGFVRDRRPDLAVSPGPIGRGDTDAGATASRPAATSPIQAGAAAPPPASSAAADPVREKVLAIVAQKTGYPPEMIDPGLDLEADLGVDTVKQAETFAAVREAYAIPREENLKLRDFPTVEHVIRFVRDRRPDLAGPGAQPATPTGGPSPVAGNEVDDAVRAKVLSIVAEKTGYPPDMIDPGLDLEADLGVDTVKQAETFAAVRQAYGIPRDENLKLRDFPTVEHVIRFVLERRPDLGGPPSAAAPLPAPWAAAPVPASSMDAPLSAMSSASAGPSPATSTDAADAFPRRVPVPVLRPPLAVCKDTAVLLQRGARVLVMPDAGGVAEALVARLGLIGVEAVLLDRQTSPDQLAARISAEAEKGLRGIYWLPALDDEGDLRAMTLEAWRAALFLRVKLLATAARALYPLLGAPGAFAIVATRLGGLHGYGQTGASAPMGGAVVGFSKALSRERPEALVKAVDFDGSRAPQEVARLLVEETLRDPGAVEIGWSGEQRFSVVLRDVLAADGKPGLSLGRDTVFVVTGAAGSIVSAIVGDLAASSGGTFHLLDLIPEPDGQSSDVKRLATDREGLKRELFERMKARGDRATPALVEKELAALERAASGAAAIKAVREAGGRAFWHSADLRDASAVARAIDAVREGSGRVDVLLHAGGLELSRVLPDKSQAEFDLVFDVKCDGWFNLIHAIGQMPLGATVAFSSVAGRFGNAGQTDYSAANDLLCKQASALRTTRPATRGIAIDWTAWAGIGMATRGSIPAMMERAGIEMLPPQVGIPTIRRELTRGGARGEVVVAGRLGTLLDERDPTGGLAPERVDTSRCGPMIGRVVGMTLQRGLEVETTLDPERQPFLRDHQIDGIPVLPGVMGVEGFGELAALLAPGYYLAAVEAIEFLAPFKFFRAQPRTLSLCAQIREEGGELVADCSLSGERTLAGQAPQITTHFTARVRLARTPPSLAPATRAEPQGAWVPADDIYRVYFHGPAYRVLERASNGTGTDTVGVLPAQLPLDHEPAEAPLLLSPRLIELCFQTAGLREMRATGHLGLPQHVDYLEAAGELRRAVGRLSAVVVDGPGGAFDAQVVDEAGNAYVRLSGYRTTPLPDALDPKLLSRLAG